MYDFTRSKIKAFKLDLTEKTLLEAGRLRNFFWFFFLFFFIGFFIFSDKYLISNIQLKLNSLREARKAQEGELLRKRLTAARSLTLPAPDHPTVIVSLDSKFSSFIHGRQFLSFFSFFRRRGVE